MLSTSLWMENKLDDTVSEASLDKG
jgi:hypothetical protein